MEVEEEARRERNLWTNGWREGSDKGKKGKGKVI